MKFLVKLSLGSTDFGKEAAGQRDTDLYTLQLGLAGTFSDCSKEGDDIWILNEPLCNRVYTDIKCHIKKLI